MSDDMKKYMDLINAAASESKPKEAPKKADKKLNESALAVRNEQAETSSVESVESLLESAKQRGFEVHEEGTLSAIGGNDTSVLIWEDGTITRGDVPLDKMKEMSLEEATKLLGL